MDEEFVMPGEVIETNKRLGSGLYMEDGTVYASVAGRLKERGDRVFVEPENPIVNVKKGDVIIGSIEGTWEKFVLVKILKVVGKQRSVAKGVYGALRVMDIARGFTERANDEFKIGDIIKAEVVQITPFDIVLSTKGPNFGVIEAYCSECRSLLKMKEGKLVCSVCGRTERRKVSRDYLIKEE